MRFLGLLLAVVISGSASAETVTALGEEAPGLFFKAPDGTWDGLAADLIRQISKKTGQPVSLTSIVWATGYRTALERPNVVLFSMVRSRERDPLFHWVGPFATLHFGLYARKGSPLTVSSLSEAKALPKIGVYTDDISDEWFTARGFQNLDRARSAGGNAKKLLAGYLPVVASSSNRLSAELAAAGEASDSVKLLYPYLTAPLYFAVSLSSDPTLVRSWTKAFQTLREDGTLAQLIAKRFPGQGLPEEDAFLP